ncbi:hypothetical protein D3C85_1234710 [compost metagenome]
MADQGNGIQAMAQRVEQAAALGQALQAADGDALAAPELLVGFIHTLVQDLGRLHVDDVLAGHRGAGADKEVVVDLGGNHLVQLAAQRQQGTVGRNHATGAVLQAP